MEAKQGDMVRVHYTVRLDDGTVIGSTTEREPLQFTIGEGKLIPGFEQAIIGMNPGESKKVFVSAEQAFGPHLDEMVIVIDRDRLPEDFRPKVGDQIQFNTHSGEIVSVLVIETSEESITIDANHPLAGKNLTFDINFVDFV